MRITGLALVAVMMAAPAAAQGDVAPMPRKGAWTFEFLTDASFGQLNNAPKACIGSDAVVDLDAPGILEYEITPALRYILAPVGPRDGSAERAWRAFRMRPADAPGAPNVVRLMPVPMTSRTEITLLLVKLSNPAARDATLAELDARIDEAEGDDEKHYLRCQK